MSNTDIENRTAKMRAAAQATREMIAESEQDRVTALVAAAEDAEASQPVTVAQASADLGEE